MMQVANAPGYKDVRIVLPVDCKDELSCQNSFKNV